MNAVRQSVLVSGSRGWLGRVFIRLLEEKLPNHQIIPLSNRGNFDFWTYDPDPDEVVGFIHLAFLTKGRLKHLPVAKYIQTNREITSRAIDIAKVARPEWIISVSSGAAVHNLDKSIYGILKLQEEQKLTNVANQIGSNLAIGRLWGASGLDMPINREYALSDFIVQAIQSREIVINSASRVWRKYSDASQFAELLFSQGTTVQFWIGDSGGPLIEIGDLALEVGQQLGIDKFKRAPWNGLEDLYFPKNSNYDQLLMKFGVSALNIKQQVEDTIRGHISQLDTIVV